MAVLIGNARKDENGALHGGAAGDQTGKEVMVQYWYSYPWNYVIRPKSTLVAEKIAACMETLCKGNLVGYDQYQRTTLWTQMEKVGFDASKLTTKCETDCSAMVAVCVRAAGIGISKDVYTGNLRQALVATGQFDVLSDSKYLSTSNYVKRGDILLNTVHHVAVALSNGTYAGTSTTPASSGLTAYNPYKAYKNGSTPEPVYEDSDCTKQYGTLNPYEECWCMAKIGSAYAIVYGVDGHSGRYKMGYVKYSGGIG